jgi:hypothetical protein
VTKIYTFTVEFEGGQLVTEVTEDVRIILHNRLNDGRAFEVESDGKIHHIPYGRINSVIITAKKLT